MHHTVILALASLLTAAPTTLAQQTPLQCHDPVMTRYIVCSEISSHFGSPRCRTQVDAQLGWTDSMSGAAGCNADMQPLILAQLAHLCILMRQFANINYCRMLLWKPYVRVV
jgi:hypothetical protein